MYMLPRGHNFLMNYWKCSLVGKLTDGHARAGLPCRTFAPGLFEVNSHSKSSHVPWRDHATGRSGKFLWRDHATGKSSARQSVPRSDPLPTASTAPRGPRRHAAHARASPRPSTDESPPQPAGLHDSASWCVPDQQELICSFHRLLPYLLARRPQHAFGTSSSSLERSPDLPDADPRQKRALLAAAAWQPPDPRRMGMRWPLHLPWHARHPAWPPKPSTPSFGPPPKPPEPFVAATPSPPCPFPVAAAPPPSTWCRAPRPTTCHTRSCLLRWGDAWPLGLGLDEPPTPPSDGPSDRSRITVAVSLPCCSHPALPCPTT